MNNAPANLNSIRQPAPSVSVTGNFDITNVYKQKQKGHSLNALLCYCVLQAAQKVDEFHYSIKEDGLYYYDYVKTNAVVNIFTSAAEAPRVTKADSSTIIKVCKGKLKTTKGYIWSYWEE